MVRHRRVIEIRVLVAIAGVLLLAGAMVGCGVGEGNVDGRGGVRSEATKQEQGRSPEATAFEEARCEGTQTVDLQGRTYTTNDVSGCPKGGPLSGTDRQDKLDGEDGDDEIRGLGGSDVIFGGLGSDVIYGGDGNDYIDGATVDYSGNVVRKQRYELYCGGGKDHYFADKLDYVSSTCEVKSGPANQ